MGWQGGPRRWQVFSERVAGKVRADGKVTADYSLEAEKAANEAAVAAAAAKEAVQSRIDALLSEGKTLDEIMEKLG